MTQIKVALVYPYFHPANDKSIFRFPPLGLGYVAAALKKRDFAVELVDCTFLSFNEAIEQVKRSCAQIIGIYSMFSMKKTSLDFAHALRRECGSNCGLLVAGGPLPSWSPESFLDTFNVVVVGEGEVTTPELADCIKRGFKFSDVKGIVYKNGKEIVRTDPRRFIEDLDDVPFPLRELFDNEMYKRYYLERFGYSTTSMITSRGCPFTCDFCSRPIFGTDFRSRSVDNIVDEVEQIASYGYERVWFADDCFTLSRRHFMGVCNELAHRDLDVGWECLSRVDTIDAEVAYSMKRAGCIRVFFGIESGNDGVLSLMKKNISVAQAKKAVCAAKNAGLQVGAFFIIGYPGESDKTVLDTVRFASSLPLDYLSFTLPYPIPGTPLYERVHGNGVAMAIDDWEEPKNYRLIRHKLLYAAGFSEAKLKFAIGKAHIQFHLRRHLGEEGYRWVGSPFEMVTDAAFKLIR